MRRQERIPLHDHVDNNSGGRIDRSTITAAAGALSASPSSSSGSSGGAHALYGPEHTSQFETPFDHGAMGAAETIDLSNGTWHRATFDADCTVTVAGFTADQAIVLVVELTQDGTGGWDITWDADVQFIGEDQPDLTAGSTTVFLLFTSLGDSTIYGVRVGAPTVAALNDLSDVTLTAPAADDTLRSVGGEWINDNRYRATVTDGFDTLVWEGDELVWEWTT